MNKPRNEAICRNCLALVRSRFRHDFAICDCFNDKTKKRGFFLDGGDDYQRLGGNINDMLNVGHMSQTEVKLLHTALLKAREENEDEFNTE